MLNLDPKPVSNRAETLKNRFYARFHLYGPVCGSLALVYRSEQREIHEKCDISEISFRTPIGEALKCHRLYLSNAMSTAAVLWVFYCTQEYYQMPKGQLRSSLQRRDMSKNNEFSLKSQMCVSTKKCLK